MDLVHRIYDEMEGMIEIIRVAKEVDTSLH